VITSPPTIRFRAVSFIGEIRNRCEKIGRTPGAYRLHPELDAGIRGCTHGNYLILFTTIDTDVLIVRVLLGARDVRRALEDELPDDERTLVSKENESTATEGFGAPISNIDS
jgi:plasmid stabilization system protein ParE